MKPHEHWSEKVTTAIGSPKSVVAHTVIFAICFIIPFFGVDFDRVLLFLTTLVSLEAIYLAIFIQMTVNRNTASLEEVEEDIEEIQEDIDEINEDIDEIQEDEEENDTHEKKVDLMLEKITDNLSKIIQDVERLKQNK